MGMTEVPAIQIEGLTFSYPSAEPVFRDFSLVIPRGKIFGLFGPNGAGKSTLMQLMTGVLPMQQGMIRMEGADIRKDPMQVRRRFGFVPQDLALYEELSPMENLDFFGALCGLGTRDKRARATEILQILGLSNVMHKPVRQFSGGMKRRVNLAVGVLHQPSILILDEPTVGVDVQTRHAILEYLRSIHARGTTLIYTSHQLSEAEELCEEVALIDSGRLLLQSPMAEVQQKHGGKGLEQVFLNMTGRAYRN
jgi:ABC-2 type transport system ATP-binding protein